MKFLSKLRSLILFVALVSINCEQPELEGPPVASLSNIDYSGEVKLENISLSEIPELENFLFNSIGNEYFKTTSKDKPIIDKKNVQKVKHGTAKANYTFNFTYRDTPEYIKYNLILSVNEDGKYAKPIVVKYSSTPEDWEAFINSGYDPAKINAKMEVFQYQDFFKKNPFKKGDLCPTLFDQYGDPIPCYEEFIENGTTGGGGGPSQSTGDSGSQPGLGTTGGYYEGKEGVYHLTPDGGLYSFSDDSVCQHNFQCTIIVYIPNEGSNQLKGASCPNCADGSSGYTATNINLAARIGLIVDQLDYALNLNTSQENYLSNSDNWAFTEELYKLYYGDKSTDSKKAIQIVLQTEMLGVTYNDTRSAFTSIVNKYNSFSINQFNDPIVHLWFVMKCAELKTLHPEWSDARVLWEASKEFIHLSLDVVGVIPGVGEPADLINGLIYFAEGDNLNGTLSLSAAVPFAGWAATGAKWAIKATKLADGTKLVLEITKKADGLLDFGKKSSRSFREQLGLTLGDNMIGHHVIPWNLNNHPIVQAAGNWRWHPHDAVLNGKAVSNTRHAGSHFNYDAYVRNRLDNLMIHKNNPQKAYEELVKLSNELQKKINDNPLTKINELY